MKLSRMLILTLIVFVTFGAASVGAEEITFLCGSWWDDYEEDFKEKVGYSYLEKFKEETGITIKAREPVFTFDVIDRDGRGDVRFHYIIVDLVADYISGEPHAGDDAAKARWISSEDLSRLKVSPATLNLLRQHFHFGR